MLQSIRNHWTHFWMRPCPPHALALVRIAVGVFLFFYMAQYLPHTTMIFSNQGVPLPLLPDLVPSSLNFLFQPFDPWIARTLLIILLLSYIGLIFGTAMRLNLIIIILLSIYFWQVSLHVFPATFHRITIILLTVLLFSGADKTLSLRMKRTHRSFFAWEPISILPQRLIALQVSASYAGSGWQKIVLPRWQGGEILSLSFISSWSTPLAHWLVRLNLPIFFYDALEFVIKLFQTTLPIGLWVRSLQKYYFVGGILFHISIALLLDIWSFIMLIPLYLLFIDPVKVKGWCEKRF